MVCLCLFPPSGGMLSHLNNAYHWSLAAGRAGGGGGGGVGPSLGRSSLCVLCLGGWLGQGGGVCVCFI
jgi:hypothetical protein